MAVSQSDDELSYVRRLREENATLASNLEVLKKGGPGGTSGGMDSVDAKIAAAEARTDTKFAELRGDLQQFATKTTVWGAVGTAVAIGLAVAAFGGDRFDSGMSAGSVVEAATKQQRERDAVQDKKLDAQARKLDEILLRLPPAKASPDAGK